MSIKKISSLLVILIFIITISPVMADTVIYDEDYSLDAGYYTWYTLEATSAPVYAHIEMSCDDDINLLIMEEVEAEKWANGEPASTFRYNDHSSLNIYHTIMETGTWYVILDNTDSLVTDKSGHIKITAVDEIPFTTAVPTTPTTEEPERPGDTGSTKSGEQTVTIPAGAYYALSLETTKDNAKVTVEFVCDGCDINFFIANDANFKAWQNGAQAKGTLRADEVDLEEEFTIPDEGIWWLVFDNTDSLLTEKTVTFTVTIASSSAPGFEIILVTLAIATILYKRKKK